MKFLISKEKIILQYGSQLTQIAFKAVKLRSALDLNINLKERKRSILLK